MPPNLDIPRTSSPPPRNSRFFELLDRFAGPALLLNSEGIIEAASANWDELSVRTSRTDLTREQIIGCPLWNLLPDEEQRRVFQEALAPLSTGQQKSFIFAWDLGSNGRVFALNLHVQPVHDDDRLSGFLVQGTDVTAEHLSRAALLDRERKLREIRAAFEKQNTDSAALKKQLEDISAKRDYAVGALLHAFETEHDDFGSAVCRLGCEAGNALFATLAVRILEAEKLLFSAQYNAPDYHRFAVETGSVELAFGEGPAGIAAQKNCPTPFNHLLTREDFATWSPLAKQYGYNCIWAFPIEDEGGLFGVLQLYYTAEEVAIPIESYAALMTLCRLAAPLLRSAEIWRIKMAAGAERTGKNTPSGMQVMAASLAEEFANLLTGVLGHSSLIAAEMGEGHAALNDVRAIEKSARGAAKLTRKLTALCGNVHHAPAPLDAAAFLRMYASRDRANFFPQGPATVDVAGDRCLIALESPSLEVILDGMAEHARTISFSDVAPVWSLRTANDSMVLSLQYEGAASLPPEWSGETPAPHARNQISELMFAREAARVVGGEITAEEQAAHTILAFTIPLAPQSAPREQT